jgi:hypothetical protein
MSSVRISALSPAFPRWSDLEKMPLDFGAFELAGGGRRIRVLKRALT